METVEELKAKFLTLIKNHDYSYQYSDDGRVWSRGQAEMENLRKYLKELLTVHNVNKEDLLKECLELREEQFTDGLTHKIIKHLFNISQ